MRTAAALAGALIIAGVMVDAFETVLLPRRVARRLRPAQGFFRLLWRAWRAGARLLPGGNRRENYLGVYALASLLALLFLWAGGLVTGFAALHWSVARAGSTFGSSLYFSGTTFFTLGLGDVAPSSAAGRALTVVEAGSGFVFLALVVSYLPVLYQAFSRREVHISMLDEWAGSPPTAAGFFRRCGRGAEGVREFLRDWERWSAELLESHISFPILAYFRSQHDDQSWLGSLTAVLDVCALTLALTDGVPDAQARRTFAMARHALVDIAQVLSTPPAGGVDRLPAGDLDAVRADLAAAGMTLAGGDAPAAHLDRLRGMYEPYAAALAVYLLLPLPPWRSEGDRDNWEKTAW